MGTRNQGSGPCVYECPVGILDIICHIAGINRIGLDLERIGKAERQKHLNTWISDHVESEVPALRRALREAQLFVRTNPVHAGLREEIDRLIEAGADVLMLPMFETVREAATFIEYIA